MEKITQTFILEGTKNCSEIHSATESGATQYVVPLYYQMHLTSMTTKMKWAAENWSHNPILFYTRLNHNLFRISKPLNLILNWFQSSQEKLKIKIKLKK